MASDYRLSHDALLDRADRAVSSAIAIRAEVQAGLEIAGQRYAVRPWAGNPTLPEVVPPAPLPPLDFLDLWSDVARVFAETGEIIRKADAELERAWHRIEPTIETPMGLIADPA